jgi:hypothetical protein
MTPQYQIFDIGVVMVGDSSQGTGVSEGNVAVGRSLRTGGSQAFSWTIGGGIVGLPNLAARSFCRSDSANDTGTIVGTCATTAFGSARLPTVWQNGVVSQLPLPAGETLGDAFSVNAAGVAVGSVNAGSTQRAVIYSGGTATIITQTTTGGSFFTTAFGINDAGRVVGIGIDPANAARNVGMVFDIGSANAFEVPALPGANGALKRSFELCCWQRWTRGWFQYVEPRLRPAVYLAYGDRHTGDPASGWNNTGFGPGCKHRRLGGRYGFVCICDPIPF